MNIFVSSYASATKFLQRVPVSMLILCVKFHPSSTIITHFMNEMAKLCISALTTFLFLYELIRWFTEIGGSYPIRLFRTWWSRAIFFWGTIAIILYSILYIHSHRSCSHRPGRVASVWWAIWCVVLPCARRSTARILSIE